MTQEQKIEVFSALGSLLNSSLTDSIIDRAIGVNSWFTPDSIRSSVDEISSMLQKDKLEKWLSSYTIRNQSKRVGVIMAGNIPLVGFHDLLCILISGNKARIKLSSKDSVLIPWAIENLNQLEPGFSASIEIVEQLKNFDAVIATGSDNSANYFKQYFSKYPHVIRKNRVSCAILDGSESVSDIHALGKDIFSYYGLGCRNVSKLFVPQGYSIDQLLDPLELYSSVIDHHKYANNYDYNKSIYLVNNEKYFDNGFLLVKESEDLVSPISVVYIEHFHSSEDLNSRINSNKEKLQCIVSSISSFPNAITPGKAQSPELWNYADNIDTMEFLTAL